MNEQEILKYNERCALFLGWKYSQEYEHYEEFFGSWDKEDDGVWYEQSDLVENPKGVCYVRIGNKYLLSYNYILKFHSDWNWIMLVVEAIEKLKTKTSTFEFHIQSKSVLIKEEKNYAFEQGDGGKTSQPLKFNNSIWITEKTKKEAVICAINQFLIWYYEHTSNRKSKDK